MKFLILLLLSAFTAFGAASTNTSFFKNIQADNVGALTNLTVAGIPVVVTASNVGPGEGVFRQKVDLDLEFRSLVEGTNIVLIPGADTVEIHSLAGNLEAGTNIVFTTNGIATVINSSASGGGAPVGTMVQSGIVTQYRVPQTADTTGTNYVASGMVGDATGTNMAVLGTFSANNIVSTNAIVAGSLTVVTNMAVGGVPIPGRTMTIRRDNLTTLPVDGLFLTNATPATAGVPVQASPAIYQSGAGYDTDGASNNPVHFRHYVLPTSGANVGAEWLLRRSVDLVNFYNVITVGADSSGFGYQSLYLNTVANSSGFGFAALFSNTGANGSGFGHSSLYENTGADSSGFGSQALFQNSGANSSGVGYQSLFQNTGANSSGLGVNSLYLNTGVSSSGLGLNSLYANTGAFSVGVGNAALYQNTGAFSSGLGNAVLYQNTGSNSVALGAYAGYTNTFPNRLFIANALGAPLIGGDFSAKTVIVNGILTATNGFSGLRANLAAPVAITFPATTVNWTNPLPVSIQVYIDNAGVTGTAIKKNGTQIFTLMTGPASVGLQVGEYFSETYSVGSPAATFSPFP